MAEIDEKNIKKIKKGKKKFGSNKLSNEVKNGKTKTDHKKKSIDTVKTIPNDFSLDDILELGGEEEDYKELLELDEDEEIETGTGTVENSLKNEIQNFMEAIGLDSDTDDKGKLVPNNKEINTTDPSDELNVDEYKIDNPTKKKKKKSEEVPIASLEYKKYDKLLVKNVIPWYTVTSEIPKSQLQPTDEAEKLHSVVKQFWDTEVAIYQQMKENDRSSDAKWLRTVLTSGTQSDKVAALTMLTQESPVHSMRSLETLMNMAQKKARREALIAVDSLRHIWIADLLPEHKLRKFNEFPLGDLSGYIKGNSKEERIKLLITMAYEEWLKKTYSEFVEILRNFSKDTLSEIRTKILGIVFELLQMKPEQEQVLLSILVNKLGDPERKVASKASYLLGELVAKHPNMKTVVIEEVERMMYRPNMSDKAQYYAICFLNQVVLTNQEQKLAAKLISIYFSFFNVIVGRDDKSKSKGKGKGPSKDPSHQNKLLSGLLTGVNRAFPFVEALDESYDEQLNTLFKLAHIKHFNTSVQTFMLIYQVMESRQSISDRYYQALYAKLLDPDINAKKHTMFLNLLYKSMKNDPVLKRVKAFVKRLLQVCTNFQPALLCGVLYLISEVIKHNPGVNSMLLQVENDDDDEEEKFVDAALDDELVKKLNASDDESDSKENILSDEKTKGSWTFRNTKDKSLNYNPNNRNPLFAGTENTCLWEILPLISHFHPSVMHFSTSIDNMKGIEYKGDPSQDFTLISFLDRFMYRNPKKKEVDHGSSLMQRKESQRKKDLPVNSKAFLQKSEENIPCDQLFFYRYFKQTMSDKDIKSEEGNDDLLDTESVNVDDIDFAGEMRRDGEIKRGKKKKSDDADDSESEDEAISEEDFDYDDIGESDEDDIESEKVNFNDKDYEEALFKNLDSDGESLDGDNDDEEKGRGDDIGDDMGSMFADAEEFSHMLENDDDDNRGAHSKQIAWEEKQDGKQWKVKKSRNKDNWKSRNKDNLKRKKNTNHENKNRKRKKGNK